MAHASTDGLRVAAQEYSTVSSHLFYQLPSLKSVAHDDHLNRWHQCLQDLPLGTIIDIQILKQLAIHAEVPVAYCKNLDIDKVENFVPAYLYKFTRHDMWQLLDEEDFILTAYQLLALMSATILTSFFGDWQLQRFLSVVSV